MRSYTDTYNGARYRVWYDRALRLWSAYRIDADGVQCADADYGTTRADAVRYAHNHWDW